MSVSGLIVGLGNPGQQYASTRHNLGFLAIEALVRHCSAVSMSGEKFRSALWKDTSPQGTWLFVCPQTFMNLSGDAVQPLAAWNKVTPERILVIHDELDIPLGRMKFKQGGGNAGHNGLKSITQRLGTPDFYRLRLGIGRPPHPAMDTASWVLGRLSTEEQTVFQNLLPAALDIVALFMRGEVTSALQEANGFRV